MPPADICFFATSKSGLGHLRRSATIVRRIKEIAPERRVHLISNAMPDGLSAADLQGFASVQVVARDRMATEAQFPPGSTMVLDTITVPGLEETSGPLALVLREAPEMALDRFRLPGGRPWDLVVVANPRDHWMPPDHAFAASRIDPVGWIYRPTGPRMAQEGGPLQVLVATGGGGTQATAQVIYAQIDSLLAQVRLRTCRRFDVVQAIGPRAADFGTLTGAGRVLDPGPALNDHFRAADIVISTAGYNSVLELATTDTPTLLVPIPRSIDDQTARARLWAGQLGGWYDSDAPQHAADWLADQIDRPSRRPPADLGPSGETRAAHAILAL